MIKIMDAVYSSSFTIHCEFSDGFCGEYDVKPLLVTKETPLTLPLREEQQFAAFFLRSGAICWKNGLELDPQAIYLELKSQGKLTRLSMAA